MYWQAYKKALQEYFIYILIAIMVGAVTITFVYVAIFYLTDLLIGDLEPLWLRNGIVLFFISFVIVLHFTPFHWEVAKNTSTRKRTFTVLQLGFTALTAGVIYTFLTLNEARQQADYQTEVYLFRDDFQGCAIIFYDIANAPPLEIVDERLTHNFLENGEVLLTSSPQQFGWANAHHSGWHGVEIYVGEKQLPGDALTMNVGSYESGQVVINYSQIFHAESSKCGTFFEDVRSLYARYVLEES